MTYRIRVLQASFGVLRYAAQLYDREILADLRMRMKHILHPVRGKQPRIVRSLNQYDNTVHAVHSEAFLLALKSINPANTWRSPDRQKCHIYV